MREMGFILYKEDANAGKRMTGGFFPASYLKRLFNDFNHQPTRTIDNHLL